MSAFNEESMREFLAEADEIVEAMAEGFSTLDEQRLAGEIKPNILNEVFRQAHSLKGLAGMFGFDAITRLAHELESLLDALRLGKRQLESNLMRLFYEVCDEFRRSLANVRNKGQEDNESVDNVIERILISTNQNEPKADNNIVGTLALSEEVLGVLTEYEEHRLNEQLRQSIPVYSVWAPLAIETFEARLTELTGALNAIGEVITTLPSSNTSGTGIDFEMVFASRDELKSVESLIESLSSDYKLSRLDGDSPQVTPPINDVLAEDEMPELASMRQVSDTVRVDIRKLDELMGIVGELVLARGGLTRISDELKSDLGFRGVAVDLHRLTRTMERRIVDLQNAIMHVRMVPLGQVFSRLSRIIRRVASEVGKEVNIQVIGEETELDKLIVEELVDPLMHLVRNSVDHGIESPEVRMASGKSPTGNISLRAFPRGNHVVIDIEDDGAGINENAVKQAAIERGLIGDEHLLAFTQRDIWNLIFHPGLSTRREANSTSGRGVGLDVVKHNISQLSGLIELDSEKGAGSRFTITLPTTLAIIQALILRVCDRVYALPLASVLEILAISPGDYCTIEGREMLQIRDQTFPVMRLEALFDLERTDEETESGAYAAVVGLAQHRIALIIDDVIGQQDIVVKSLGAYLSKVRGVAGATHMGDHETILVLDVGALIEETIERSEHRFRQRGAL